MWLNFNRNPIQFGGSIEQPTEELVKNTLGLHNASIDDALKYGGELTRAAIGAMPIQFDKKHVVVDTKIHMLLPGMCPAIPGWHTDGVPRGDALNPTAKAKPNIHAQESMESPRFHLLVTGESCLTDFLDKGNVELEVPDEPSTDLYRMLTSQVEAGIEEGYWKRKPMPSCTSVTWDWWDLHTGTPAKAHEWRFLIRVTESDHHAPKTDLREIIRTQQQGYMPMEFGW